MDNHSEMIRSRMDEDPVTITGISGRFPESSSVDEFWSHLISGHDLITRGDRRWPIGEHIILLVIVVLHSHKDT